MSQSYTRSYNGYVFTLPGVRVYWANNNAQAWCSQNGSRLLEIKNSYIQNLTIQFLYETGVQFADGTLLITNGLRTDRSSWNWVNGQGISKSFLCIHLNIINTVFTILYPQAGRHSGIGV